MRTVGKWAASVFAVCFAMASAVAAQAEELSAERIAAAKAEGKLVFYCGACSAAAPETAKIIKLFESKYGIPVEFLETAPGAMQERIRTDVATGRRIADVSMQGGTSTYFLSKIGALQPHGELPNMKALTMTLNVPDEVPAWSFVFGMLINTNLVPPGQEPKSWKDVLDPKWKGKILAADFAAPGAGTTFFDLMKRTYGVEFHEKLAKQDVVVGRELRQNQRRIGLGEFAIYLNETVSDANRPKGLPYKMIVPEEGAYFTPVSLAVVKGAPHPNAADLFLNFMLDQDTQLIYAESAMPVAIKGLEERVPAEKRSMVYVKFMGSQQLEGQDERAAEAKKIYGVR